MSKAVNHKILVSITGFLDFVSCLVFQREHIALEYGDIYPIWAIRNTNLICWTSTERTLYQSLTVSKVNLNDWSIAIRNTNLSCWTSTERTLYQSLTVSKVNLNDWSSHWCCPPLRLNDEGGQVSSCSVSRQWTKSRNLCNTLFGILLSEINPIKYWKNLRTQQSII
jgi:hypothetical protein